MFFLRMVNFFDVNRKCLKSVTFRNEQAFDPGAHSVKIIKIFTKIW